MKLIIFTTTLLATFFVCLNVPVDCNQQLNHSIEMCNIEYSFTMQNLSNNFRRDIQLMQIEMNGATRSCHELSPQDERMRCYQTAREQRTKMLDEINKLVCEIRR